MKRGKLIAAIIMLVICIALLYYIVSVSFGIYSGVRDIKDFSKYNANKVELYSIFRPDMNQLSVGYPVEMREGDIVTANLDDEDYSIKLLGLNASQKRADFVINNFIFFTDTLAQERKIDLDNNDVLEISVVMESISGDSVKMIIKEINEKRSFIDVVDSRMDSAINKMNDNYKWQLNSIIIILALFLVVLIYYIFRYHIIPDRKTKRQSDKNKPGDVMEFLSDEFRKEIKKGNKIRANKIFYRIKHLYNHMSDDDKKNCRSDIKDMERYIN